MAHPYHKHSEHKKAHARVGHILHHEPAGAREHDDGGAYSKAKSKAQVVEHGEHHAPGAKAPGRYARGGKVGHKKGGHQTNIAIVVPHHAPPGAGPQAGAGAGPPPPAPAPPPGGLPPGLMGPGPGGPPPPGPGGPMPPMRASGGRVPGGIATAHNLKGWAAHARAHSFASGGVVKAGAATGVGRLQQFHAEKRK